jgi:uncharacterized membrane protein YozB (DUF420 family)
MKTVATISRREWRWVGAIILFVLALTSLPYIYGYLSSPSDKQFMGLMLDIPDHGQYLSWWRSFQSSLLASNKLTPEPNDPLFFNLLWWTLAQVSRWTGWGYALVFQLFRWLAGASFLWALYRLLAQLLPDMRQRWTAFMLITFTSGLGWVLVLLKYTLTDGKLLYPLDVFVAEGNSFLCILAFPHFTLALTFIALIFEFVWRGWKEERTRHMVVAGVLSLLLGWMHTYDLLIIYGVVGAFALLIWLRDSSPGLLRQDAFPWSLFWGGVIVVALSFSGALYSVVLTTADPLWEQVLDQFSNAGVFTPSPPHMLILFGFPLALAVGACIVLVRKKQWSAENLFVVGWFVAGALLNYVPTDFQIHMLNSWQIPMLLLVVRGLDCIAPVLAQRWPALGEKTKHWVTVAFIVVVLPTNIYLYTWRFTDLSRHDYPFYLHRDDVAALDWLQDNTSPDDIVLSSLTLGQYVPALSGNTAYLAHWAQTVDFYDKESRVARFFDAPTSDQERAETLRAFDVGYIIHGPAERVLGEYDPASTPWLELAFSAPQAQVYRVQKIE